MSKSIFLILLLLSLIDAKETKNLKGTYSFTVNGKKYTTDRDYSMMKFLREELGLTSVKDGCDQGACGSCSVIVDGDLVKTCVKKTSKFDGKNIITVEGLSDREKEVFTYAFGVCGAVQCGYCIPGMVLAAKVLLDENLDPTREQIAYAIRNNICRCTGYLKIIDAIELSAKIIRENIIDFKQIDNDKIGKRASRIDVPEKILGYGKYVDDIYIDGMLYGGAVRSKYPRAKIISIDISKAKALEGVRSVITAEDVPGENIIGHLIKDHDVMVKVGDITKFLGDAIVLIAADTEEILEQAKKLVKIEYEELQGVFNPQDALKPNAPKVHPNGNILGTAKIKRGKNVDEIFKNAPHVVSKNYTTPWGEHAYLDRECAVAIYDKDTKGALVYTTDQGPHDTQRMCADTMGWERDRIHIKHLLIGGGFGGKEGDMTVQHHALLLSYFTNLPVKFKLSRDESILIHAKRHPAWIEMTTACDKNGKLLATKARAIIDTGAYAIVGMPVLNMLVEHAPGPYNYTDIDIEGTAVYTNNPPGGAFRGFGVTQACFAIESNLNLLAEKAGISPWKIRYINAVRPGDRLPFGQLTFPHTALVETLDAVKDVFENHPRAGIACGYKNAGMGGGIPEFGRVRLTVEEGKVYIRSGGVCMGQGLGTILVQIVREVVGLKENQIVYTHSETTDAPDCGTSAASRVTVFAGEACKRACLKLKKMLEAYNGDLAKLNGKSIMGEYKADTKAFYPYPNTNQSNPIPHTGFGYGTQVVLLNEDGSVEKVIAAYDVGRAMNPLSIEGQIEGGVVMGIGYAFTERFPLKDGKPLAKMGQLGLFRADKVPEVQSIIIEKGKDSDLAFGANGIGEVVHIPTAAACQGAYYKFDKTFRTVLPLQNTYYSKKEKKNKKN